MQVTAGASVEAPAESLPGLVAAFRFTDGGMEEVAVDKPIAEQPGSWLWIQFNLADARASRYLKSDQTFPPVPEICLSLPTNTSSSTPVTIAFTASCRTLFARSRRHRRDRLSPFRPDREDNRYR
jgi:hypothetical protein